MISNLVDFFGRLYISALGKIGTRAEKLAKAIRKRRFRDVDRFLRSELGRNRELNDSLVQKRAFIIGTGPSLSSLDLSKLQNEVTFAVNSYFRHPSAACWSPNFYCINDPSWFIIDGQPGKMNSTLREIPRICSASVFLVSRAAKESLQQGQLPADRTRLVNFTAFAPGDFSWKPRLDRSLPAAFNIIHSAVLEAMATGCNPIYLIGCDHDSMEFTNFTWGHFYEEPKEEEATTPFLSRFTEQDFYDNTVGITVAYKDLLRIADLWGFRILNATRGGSLEVFKRVDYDSLF
jgi:hypothetical protein